MENCINISTNENIIFIYRKYEMHLHDKCDLIKQ